MAAARTTPLPKKTAKTATAAKPVKATKAPAPKKANAVPKKAIAAPKKAGPEAKPTPPAAAKPHRVFGMSFASVYVLYVQKAEKKQRTKQEVDAVVSWLTGYDAKQLKRVLDEKVDFETFFAQAPAMNPNVRLIKGVVCGVRVEDVPDPLMQKIRYLDLLVDELARGKKLESILRSLARRGVAR